LFLPHSAVIGSLQLLAEAMLDVATLREALGKNF